MGEFAEEAADQEDRELAEEQLRDAVLGIPYCGLCETPAEDCICDEMGWSDE